MSRISRQRRLVMSHSIIRAATLMLDEVAERTGHQVGEDVLQLALQRVGIRCADVARRALEVDTRGKILEDAVREAMG